jgi:hypothetical protein
MTEHEIIEGNSLILEFDGYVVRDFGVNGIRYIEKNKEGRYSIYFYWKMLKDTQYHKSFDELIPVCVKIKKIVDGLSLEDKIYDEACSRFANISIASARFDIDELYRAVVNFLKCYKQQELKDFEIIGTKQENPELIKI